MDLRISLNKHQLAQLQRLLSPSPRSFWRSDALLRTVQTTAVVVGGCWVLVQFFLFKSKQTQLDINKTALQVQLEKLEEQKRSADIMFSQTYRFSAKRSLLITYNRHLASGENLYTATYGIKVANRSTTPFELSLWVIDLYQGTIHSALYKKRNFIEQIGYPPNRWNPGSQTGGAVSWTLMGSSGAILANAIGLIASPWDDDVQDVNLVPGGPFTGLLKPDQSYSMDNDYLVKGKAGSYVAFVQSICFNRCKKNPQDLYQMSTYAVLPAAPPTHGAAHHKHTLYTASHHH